MSLNKAAQHQQSGDAQLAPSLHHCCPIHSLVLSVAPIWHHPDTCRAKIFDRGNCESHFSGSPRNVAVQCFSVRDPILWSPIDTCHLSSPRRPRLRPIPGQCMLKLTIKHIPPTLPCQPSTNPCSHSSRPAPIEAEQLPHTW